MAKMIKFPLEMGDGVKIRTIEELRENFGAEKMVGHFASGKLQVWLSDRHYKAELEEVEMLNINCENLVQELYRIFRIEYRAEALEVEAILEKQKLQRKLRQFTDDNEILEHLDRVAVNQMQFDSLLDMRCPIIYLLGECFRLRKDIGDVQIRGINESILEIESDVVIDFESLHIEIFNCCFDDKYLALQVQKKEEVENAYKRKKGTYEVSKEFDYKLSNEERQESEKLYRKIQEHFEYFEFDIDSGSKGIYEVLNKADIWDLFDIDRYGAGVKSKLEEANLNIIGTEFLERIS